MDYLKKLIIPSKFDKKKKIRGKTLCQYQPCRKGHMCLLKNSKRASLTTLYR